MSEAVADQVTSVLGEVPSIRLAILFGSCARGQATAASDIDIAVLGDRPLDPAARVDLVNLIASRTGRAVDLVDLREAGEPLLGRILLGVRLLGSDIDHAALITRHLTDSADFLPLRERILEERRRAWTG